ncbi:hypothetical protein L228DRAFT_286213 [Xylona heveae TC161]|uniref:Uncharacterized protein n=1 Tax=Xylona heveae (strain CBS 132557 / TC161) TaxID=1328760 RepID=A0A164ZDX3_XYLHT|nr:hypothetical protein L228DRAFT_286213 [Xylona heveae TC161]KZF18980.1 hypothetical protein L228DRAFT_286213 [Xylona heveae TC161]
MTSPGLLDTQKGPEKNSKQEKKYRPVRPLPYELRQHCIIYFEEELYHQALSLLLDLVGGGTDTWGFPHAVPAYVPPPQHFALAATLIVHPGLTTRARSSEFVHASNAAVRLVRIANKLMGPINADFGTAFTFTGLSVSRRGGGSSRRRVAAEQIAAPRHEDADAINSEIANEGGLYALAEDFWHVVGWAFNCSVSWKRRWLRWKLWLETMLEVLEDDWIARENLWLDNEDGEEELEVLENSLIARYLRTDLNRYGGVRRIVRAIFADGSSTNLNEFREVFRKETKERKRKQDPIFKREQRVNIDEDNFGDYLDENEDDDDDDDNTGADPYANLEELLAEDGTPEQSGKRKRGGPGRRVAVKAEEDTKGNSMTVFDSPSFSSEDAFNGSEPLGGMEAVQLRRRLLYLLSAVSHALPDSFTPITSLYDLYLDHLRPLPLAKFNLFISPIPVPTFNPSAHSSLVQLLLRSMLASSAPALPRAGPARGSRGERIRKSGDSTSLRDSSELSDFLTQDLLERHFLPFAASSAGPADNAKVSLMLECLMRLLAMHVGLSRSPTLGSSSQEPNEGSVDKSQDEDPSQGTLRRAVEQGIAAREEKAAKPEGRKRKKVAGSTSRASPDKVDIKEEDARDPDWTWLRTSSERLRVLVDVAETDSDHMAVDAEIHSS